MIGSTLITLSRVPLLTQVIKVSNNQIMPENPSEGLISAVHSTLISEERKLDTPHTNTIVVLREWLKIVENKPVTAQQNLPLQPKDEGSNAAQVKKSDPVAETSGEKK